MHCEIDNLFLMSRKKNSWALELNIGFYSCFKYITSQDNVLLNLCIISKKNIKQQTLITELINKFIYIEMP